jgi:hypothetical protein
MAYPVGLGISGPGRGDADRLAALPASPSATPMHSASRSPWRSLRRCRTGAASPGQRARPGLRLQAQRDPQRPHALRAGLHRDILLIGWFMRVRAQHVTPARMEVLRTVVMIVIVAGAMQIAHNPKDADGTLLQHLDHSATYVPARRPPAGRRQQRAGRVLHGGACLASPRRSCRPVGA